MIFRSLHIITHGFDDPYVVYGSVEIDDPDNTLKNEHIMGIFRRDHLAQIRQCARRHFDPSTTGPVPAEYWDRYKVESFDLPEELVDTELTPTQIRELPAWSCA